MRNGGWLARDVVVAPRRRHGGRLAYLASLVGRLALLSAFIATLSLQFILPLLRSSVDPLRQASRTRPCHA